MAETEGVPTVMALLPPDSARPASFAAGAAAALIGGDIILSFGHYDPLTPTEKQPGPPAHELAKLRTFEQIAMSRVAFSQLIAQSILMLHTEDRDTFGWSFIEEAP